MGLEEQIADALIHAMEDLGGDSQKAVSAAMETGSLENWLRQETTQVALSGGAEMLIPGLHSLTIPMGVSFLLHKMARLSWGIGALKGAYIIETEEYSDLRNILAIWASDMQVNANMMEHVSISMNTFLYTAQEEGYGQLTNVISRAEMAEVDNIIVNSLHVLKMLVEDFPEDEKAFRMIASIAGDEQAEQALEAVNAHYQNRSLTALIDKPLGRKISLRLALKLAEKLGARLPAKFIMGFIPVAGIIVNAFLNAHTLRGFSEAAIKYYDTPFTQDDLMTLDF